MTIQNQINYNRIAEAINYIKMNFKEQPDLDVVAEKVHLSPFHFQRLFTEWAGTSPKKFLQYTSMSLYAVCQSVSYFLRLASQPSLTSL